MASYSTNKSALAQAIDLAKSGIANTVNPVTQGVGNFVQSFSQGLQNYGNQQNALARQRDQQAYNFAQNIIGKSSQGIHNFVTDLPANSSYVQAKVAQAIAPKYTLPVAGDPNTPRPMINTNPQFNYDDSQEKTNSAYLNEFPVAPNTPYNQQLEAQKQNILKSGAFRPAMARYLSTVPVYGGNDNPGGGMTEVGPQQTYVLPNNSPEMNAIQNQSWENYQGPEQPSVEIGMQNGNTNVNTQAPSQDPRLNAVMVHELIHASPRNQADKDAFIKFYENLTPESSPILYKAGLTYLQNGQKPPNPEELYATLAQNVGPKILQYPEVRKFFENIFNK